MSWWSINTHSCKWDENQPQKHIFAAANLIFSGHKPSSDEVSSGPEKVIEISSMTSL